MYANFVIHVHIYTEGICIPFLPKKNVEGKD